MKVPGALLYQWFRQGIRNSFVRPWLIMGVFVYVLSPIDLIPSFLPGIGEIDDLVLIGILITELTGLWWTSRSDPQMATDTRQAGSGKKTSQPSTPQSSAAANAVIDIQAQVIDPES